MNIDIIILHSTLEQINSKVNTFNSQNYVTSQDKISVFVLNLFIATK